MVTPESSEHATWSFEHPNPEEVEEFDFKHNLMKIMETLKQEVKIFLKEMKEKTTKKLKEINKSLKDTQENQKKKSNQTGKGNNSRFENPKWR